MPRRASERRLLKHQPFAFSPFLRSLALALTSRRRLPHPKDSQDMSFDERLPSLSKKEASSDEDEEDSEGYVVQGDFEFFDPKPTDFNGVKILLKNYLHDKEWDLSSFVDLILEQTTVGTVVKATDDEDESVFAVVSVLNLARYKENKCFRELKEFLLQVCSEKDIASDLELLLEEKAKDVGILVSSSHQDLQELRNRNQRRPRRGEEDILFSKAEDEFFLKLSSWSFTFPIRSQLVRGHDQPMGLVMAVDADKIPEFRQILHSLLDE